MKLLNFVDMEKTFSLLARTQPSRSALHSRDSLLRKRPLCATKRLGHGRGERKRAGDDGKGREGVPHALTFFFTFFYISFWNTSGSLCGGEGSRDNSKTWKTNR